MKIAFFTENQHQGGLDTFLVALLRNWPATDELIVICNDSHPGLGALKTSLAGRCRVEGHGLRYYPDLVEKLRGRTIGRILHKVLAPVLRSAYFVYYCFALRRILTALHPDRLLIVNGGHPGGDTCRAAAIGWGQPMRCWYSFHNLAKQAALLERVFDWFVDSVLLRSTTAVLCVSEACVRSIRARRAFAEIDIRIVYNGIEEPDQRREVPALPIRALLDLPPSSDICLMLATYEERKGHAFLLRAFSEVVRQRPNAFLLICGSSHEHEIRRVRSLVAQSGLAAHVRLESFRSDAMALLREADLLVAPSQAFESFGLTLVEAMARRVPVVATNVGGMPEVVKNGFGGYCVDRHDVSAFAEAVVSLLKDPGLRREQGERGHERYKKLFTAKTMAASYAALIRDDRAQ